MLKKKSWMKTALTLGLAWSVATGASVASIAAHAAAASTKPDSAAISNSQDKSGPAHAAPGSNDVTVTTSQSLDRTGRPRIGKASFYAARYSGRTMSDGTPMRPESNNAASLTLPLGTTAKVTNLESGKSALVTIRDRGPYVKGRIIDLSPATARRIGLSKKAGLAKVEVLPIAVPLADGSVNFSAAALIKPQVKDQG